MSIHASNVCLFVWLVVCSFIFRVCLFICLSVCLLVRLFGYLLVSLLACCLSVCLSVCSFACLPKVLTRTGADCCRCADSADKQGGSAELKVLLEATLQKHAQTEQALQARLQQHQTDLQALHHGLEDSDRQQQEQQTCLQQTQVCRVHALTEYCDAGVTMYNAMLRNRGANTSK